MNGPPPDTRIDLFEVDLPLARPLVTSRGSIGIRRLLLVRITTAEGVGWGEAAPLPGFSSVSPPEARYRLEVWMEACRTTGTVAPLREGPPVVAAAVESALVDLAATGSGMPVSDWLASRPGPGRTSSAGVAVNGVVSGSDPGDVATAAAELARSGHPVLKIKVGADGPDTDIERVRAAAHGSGGLPLRLDANGAWDRATATTVLSALGDSHIEYVEEPTADPTASAAMCAELGLGLALDESWRDPRIGLALARAGRLHTAVLKPSALGGPLTTLRLARSLADLGVRIVISSLMDGPVGLAAATHLAAAVGGGAHGLGTAALFASRFDPWLYPVEGRLCPPGVPGLGTGLNPAEASGVRELGGVSGPMTLDAPASPARGPRHQGR